MHFLETFCDLEKEARHAQVTLDAAPRLLGLGCFSGEFIAIEDSRRLTVDDSDKTSHGGEKFRGSRSDRVSDQITSRPMIEPMEN
ncbi:hypothetical protein D3C78_1782730 [compost metagenome]